VEVVDDQCLKLPLDVQVALVVRQLKAACCDMVTKVCEMNFHCSLHFDTRRTL